jgi:hypothetical protein
MNYLERLSSPQLVKHKYREIYTVRYHTVRYGTLGLEGLDRGKER